MPTISSFLPSRVTREQYQSSSTLQPTPKYDSSQSTLKPAQTTSSTTTFSPKLEPPTSYLQSVLSLQPRIDETLRKELTYFQLDSTMQTTALEILEKEKEDTLRKYAEETAARHSWSVLATVAQYIASSSAIFLGIRTGGWAGSALIASGTLGLGSKVIHDTIGWKSVAAWFSKNQEIQKSLEAKIEMGAFHLALGLGLVGGMWAYQQGHLFTLAQGSSYAIASDKIGQIVGTASSIAGGAAHFGGSFSTQKTENYRADIKELEAKSTLNKQIAQKLCTDAVNMIETADVITGAIGKSIKDSEINSTI